MDRSNIEKIARTTEEKMLLSKLWDKIQTGLRRGIPASTGFLSPSEQPSAKVLVGDLPGLFAFGGYADAERKMLIFLPEYLDGTYLDGEDSPVVCLHAEFYQGDTPTHRDFLGALMGSGVAREAVGDICVGSGCCDFFVTEQIAPYLLQNFTGAGRTKVRLSKISLQDVTIAPAQTKEIRDTLASLRLDSVISSGFRIGRSLAVDYVTAGKTSIDGLPCEKPDKPVEEGQKISIRGLGKILLSQVNGQTKKGRIGVTILRYI